MRPGSVIPARVFDCLREVKLYYVFAAECLRCSENGPFDATIPPIFWPGVIPSQLKSQKVVSVINVLSTVNLGRLLRRLHSSQAAGCSPPAQVAQQMAALSIARTDRPDP